MIDVIACIGGGDVDAAARVARGVDRTDDLDAIAPVRQAYRANALDRPFERAGEPGQHRSGLAGPSEKNDVDAVGKMLVGQHPDARTAIHCSLDLGGKVVADGNVEPGRSWAGTGDQVGDRLLMRRAYRNGDVNTQRLCHQRRHLPIRQVGGEEKRRLAVQAIALEVLDRRLVHDDPSTRPVSRPDIADAVELGVLHADPAEVVPDAAQDVLDFGGALFRERRGKIFSPDAVLGNEAADDAHGLAGNCGRERRRKQPHQPKAQIQRDADDGVGPARPLMPGMVQLHCRD